MQGQVKIAHRRNNCGRVVVLRNHPLVNEHARLSIVSIQVLNPLRCLYQSASRNNDPRSVACTVQNVASTDVSTFDRIAKLHLIILFEKPVRRFLLRAVQRADADEGGHSNERINEDRSGPIKDRRFLLALLAAVMQYAPNKQDAIKRQRRLQTLAA